MGNPTVTRPTDPPHPDEKNDDVAEGKQHGWAFWVDKLGEGLAERLAKQDKAAADQKKLYEDKLEAATNPSEMFKFFLLINVASLEKYIAQTRLQAQLSFRLCKRVALWSFVLILLGVFIAIVLPLVSLLSAKWPSLGKITVNPLQPAGLVTLSGLITQFISSVFFYFYNRTLQQFNLFGDKLSAAQRVAICLLVNGSITDDAARNSSSAELAKAVLAYSPPPEPQAQEKQAEK